MGTGVSGAGQGDKGPPSLPNVCGTSCSVVLSRNEPELAATYMRYDATTPSCTSTNAQPLFRRLGTRPHCRWCTVSPTSTEMEGLRCPKISPGVRLYAWQPEQTRTKLAAASGIKLQMDGAFISLVVQLRVLLPRRRSGSFQPRKRTAHHLVQVRRCDATWWREDTFCRLAAGESTAMPRGLSRHTRLMTGMHASAPAAEVIAGQPMGQCTWRGAKPVLHLQTCLPVGELPSILHWDAAVPRRWCARPENHHAPHALIGMSCNAGALTGIG